MKNEAQTIEALMQHALQEKDHAIISAQEIAAALNTLNNALKTVHVCVHRPEDVLTNLQYAASVLSGLLYTITADLLPVDNSIGKSLIKQITALHKKINCYLGEYTEEAQPQCHLLPVKSLLRTLAAINETLQQNDDIEPIYAFLKPALEIIISPKTIHYHRWLWWSKFASVYEASIQNLCSFRDLLVTLNFNTAAFINWVAVHITAETEAAATVEEALQVCMQTITKYERLHVSSTAYVPAEGSVKQAILHSLKRKLLLLTKIPLTEQPAFKNSFTR